jgi:hypothetical protein
VRNPGYGNRLSGLDRNSLLRVFGNQNKTVRFSEIFFLRIFIRGLLQQPLNRCVSISLEAIACIYHSSPQWPTWRLKRPCCDKCRLNGPAALFMSLFPTRNRACLPSRPIHARRMTEIRPCLRTRATPITEQSFLTVDDQS